MRGRAPKYPPLWRARVVVWVLLVALLVFACYYRVSYREFGGITGDLAGWFLQLCEAAILLSVVLAQKLF